MSIEFQDVIGDNYYGGRRMRMPERRECRKECKAENSGDTWCDCGAKEANLMHDLFTAYLKDRQLDEVSLAKVIFKCMRDSQQSENGFVFKFSFEFSAYNVAQAIIREFNAGGLWK